MIKLISGLNTEQIAYFLEEIRRVAGLDGDLALAEADKLMWEILSSNSTPSGMGLAVNEPPSIAALPPEWTEHADALEENECETLRELVASFQSKIDNGADINPHDMVVLESRVSWLGSSWDKRHKEELAGQTAELREAAESLLVKLHQAFHMQHIAKANNEEISGVSSVQRIYRELKEANAFFLKQKQLTAEMRQQIRSGRERAAKFRAMKKISEAEVAVGGGNQKKAEKLRAEASVMLKQDWAVAFPNEDAPAIPEL